MDEVVIIDGGTVTCVEGTRIWARFYDDGREVLILIKYGNSLKNDNECTQREGTT